MAIELEGYDDTIFSRPSVGVARIQEICTGGINQIKTKVLKMWQKVERKASRYQIMHIPILNFGILGIFGYLLVKLSFKYHELYTKSSLLATIATNVVLYGISDTCAQSIGTLVDWKNHKANLNRQTIIRANAGYKDDIPISMNNSEAHEQNSADNELENDTESTDYHQRDDSVDLFVDYGDASRENSVIATENEDHEAQAYISYGDGNTNNYNSDWNDQVVTTKFDAKRFIGFITWGFIMAFIQVVWYTFLNAMFNDMPSVVSVLERDLTDQLLFSPLSLACFFAYSTIIIEGGDWERYSKKMYKMYITTLGVSISVWFPVQFINFLVMPRGFQVPFSSSVGVLWNCFLSFRNSRG